MTKEYYVEIIGKENEIEADLEEEKIDESEEQKRIEQNIVTRVGRVSDDTNSG